MYRWDEMRSVYCKFTVRFLEMRTEKHISTTQHQPYVIITDTLSLYICGWHRKCILILVERVSFGYIILICVDRTIRFSFLFSMHYFFPHCLFRVVHNLVSFFFYNSRHCVLTNVIGLNKFPGEQLLHSLAFTIFIYLTIKEAKHVHIWNTVLSFTLGPFYPVDHCKRTVMEKAITTIGTKPDFS